MDRLEKLIDSNKAWASDISSKDPEFFKRLSEQQSPKFLWIGCSDSRVPATQVCGLEPGEIFVHRNIANQVHRGDTNCLTVLQYSVDFLKVTDIIVCGHYGCGGVEGAINDIKVGFLGEWLAPIRDAYEANKSELEAMGPVDRCNRLVELNVEEQVRKLSRTNIVQQAWANGQQLSIHGIVYGLKDGILKDLKISKKGI